MTSAGGDVLTLQFGEFSNYVGTHFWNAQDELIGAQAQGVPDASGVDVSGLYRVSGAGRQLRYLPRALIYDLKSSLGSLLAAGYSDGDATTAAPRPDSRALMQTWQGNVEHHESAPVRRHTFQSYLASEADNSTPATSGGKANALQESDPEFNFNDTVKSWSDYLKSYLHPRSVQTLVTETEFVPGPTTFSV